MNTRLNHLLTRLALLQLRTIAAAARDDNETIRRVDRLVGLTLDAIEKTQEKTL